MTWWNSAWTKKKSITLTGGASGAQSAYQLKLTVTWDSDMKSDFSDLRFTNGAEDTLLDSWLESHTASTSAVVWVETDTPANTVDADIYMYYGNSGASSAWSGANTFLQYHGTATADYLDSLVVPTSNYVFESRVKSVNSNTVRCGVGTSGSGGAETTNILLYISINRKYLQSGTTAINTTQSLSNGTFYNLKIINNGSIVRGYIDGTEILSGISTDMPTSSMGLFLDVSASAEQTYSFARKYAANPATYVFNAEESSGTVIPVIMRFYRNMRNN